MSSFICYTENKMTSFILSYVDEYSVLLLANLASVRVTWKFFMSVRIDSQTVLWEICCLEQPQLTICYEHLLLRPSIFMAPLHLILTNIA